MKKLLFLCTGNYYRSRFAELLFNAKAAQRELKWQADSRGLELFADNIGPLSRHAVLWLRTLGVEAAAPVRFPLPLTEADLKGADLIVAVKQAEHFPMLERMFPAWAPRIEYWQIHDLDVWLPEEALPLLAEQVERLAQRLSGEPAGLQVG